MRQAYGQKKVRFLAEKTGLPLVAVWNRGGNGPWRLAQTDDGRSYYIDIHTFEAELNEPMPGIYVGGRPI